MSAVAKNKPREIKRGANRGDECVFVGAWLPSTLAVLLDVVVAESDSDRSKYLRQALNEKIRREKTK